MKKKFQAVNSKLFSFLTMSDPRTLLAPRVAHELPRNISSLYTVAGMDTSRRQNVIQVDERTVLYAAGNSIVLLDLLSKKRNFLLGLDGGSVGCFDLHPEKNFLAVGGCGQKPRIYIYRFPDLKLEKVRPLTHSYLLSFCTCPPLAYPSLRPLLLRIRSIYFGFFSVNACPGAHGRC